MKIGDEVTFQITGYVGRFKGIVVTLNGHNNRPEIRVTHFERPPDWVRTYAWLALKDGDYILE